MTTTPTAAARVSGTIKALDRPSPENATWTICPETLIAIRDASGYQCDELDLEHVEAIALAVEARILAAIQPDPEPSARDALQAIADMSLGRTEEVMEGQESAYRAVEALFDNPPMITCTPTDPEPQPAAAAVVSEFPVGMRPLDVSEQMAADVRAAVQHFAQYNVPLATAVGVLEIVKQELMQEAWHE